MKIITFPRMGDNFTQACFEALRDFFLPYSDKIRVIKPLKVGSADFNLGTEIFPELFCAPIKITMSSLIKTAEHIRKNFNPESEIAIAMFDSQGRCRLHTYWIHYNYAFKHSRNILNADKIISYPLTFSNIHRSLATLIESEFGFKQALKMAKNLAPRLLESIYKMDQPVINAQCFNSCNGNFKPKVGLIGEIYTVNAEEFNGNLLDKMRKQDVDTHIFILPSQFILNKILEKKKLIGKLSFLKDIPLPGYLNGWKWVFDANRKDMDYPLLRECREEAEKIFPAVLGGHGKENIVSLLYYIKSGFNGAIHVLPFPCMPESTVSGILDKISQDYKFPLMRLIFDQNVGEADIQTRVEAFCETLKMRKQKNVGKKRGAVENNLKAIGVDLGSVTTKGAVVKKEGNGKIIIENEVYLKTNRDPLVSIKTCISALCQNDALNVNGIGVTGSGRFLAKAVLGADKTINEITAQILACREFYPRLKTIFEIGGQDSKVIYLENGIPIYFDMNSICAAGTGAFLEKVAADFNLPLDDLNEMALDEDKVVEICGRCGIFACSDIISKQQRGVSKEVIFKSVCRSLVKNYLARLAKITPEEPIIFTGGVALNKAVVQALEEITKKEIIVFPYNKTSGAIGAALWVLESHKEPRLFSPLSIIEAGYEQSYFQCEDCGNRCEVSRICRNGECLAVFGSKCGKYEL